MDVFHFCGVWPYEICTAHMGLRHDSAWKVVDVGWWEIWGLVSSWLRNLLFYPPGRGKWIYWSVERGIWGWRLWPWCVSAKGLEALPQGELVQLSCSCPLLPFPFQDCKKCATLLIPVVPWAKVGICSSLQCSREHKMTSINFMLFLSPSPICSSSRALPSAQAQCLSPPAAVGWGCPWIRISSTLMCIYAGCLRSPCKLGYSQAFAQQTWPPASRVPENSASYGYHILLCGFCQGSEGLSKGIICLEWSLTTKPQNVRFSQPQKPCLQLSFFLVVWVEKNTGLL